jgi:hypothetical protein
LTLRKTAGIPTEYNGVIHRSRLEAKWAMLMHRMAWAAEYEAIDGSGYIPDFIIQGANPIGMEVKDDVLWQHLHNHAEKVDRGMAKHWSGVLLIVGATNLLVPKRDQCAGIIRDTRTHRSLWLPAQWCRCRVCDSVAIYDSQSRRLAPCGHRLEGDLVPVEGLETVWKQISNWTQWRGPA